MIYTCDWCGKEFQSERWKRYCCPACKKNHDNKAARDRRAAGKAYTTLCICSYCGKTFESPRQKKYCSDRCARDKANADHRSMEQKKSKKGSFDKVIKKLGSGSAYAEHQKAESIEKYARIDIDAQIKAIKARG